MDGYDLTKERYNILNDKSALTDHTIRVLHEQSGWEQFGSRDAVEPLGAAGVLLLLSHKFCNNIGPRQPCLILNKRSSKVRQPGDLCCPGGSVAPLVDPYLARLFSLPFLSLGRWKYWHHWKKKRTSAARLLALIWATGLRESFEEMRLNPFGARFLGPLPPQTLTMFQRTIYPLVAWVERQKRFCPNWEVEKIVDIPLKNLLNPAHYARYRLCLTPDDGSESLDAMRSYPCFRIQIGNDTELLWGATYRIVTLFMNYCFGFKPPDHKEIPIINGSLDQNYLTGYK
jgi:hypothetical protein